MAWMRQLLDWQREAADPGEFLESLRYDLAVKEIFVFTPKGDVVTLPAGSCPVDFAYAVHTEVGHRCIGARVNGRLVALERTLDNGEVVEVFTSKAATAGPSRDWQGFVASPRAKTKIRQWFAKERREEALEAGKDGIAKEVRRGGLPLQRLMNAESMSAIDRARATVRRRFRSLHRGRRESRIRSPRGAAVGRPSRWSRRRRGRARRAVDTVDHSHSTPSGRRRGRAGHRCRGRRRETREVLYAGAGRRDPRIRHPWWIGECPPHRLHQRTIAGRAVRAVHRGSVGTVGVLGVPGRHPDRGTGPSPTALRRHQGARRRASQHSLGIGCHVRGPGGDRSASHWTGHQHRARSTVS